MRRLVKYAVLLVLSTPSFAHDPVTGQANWITNGKYLSRDGVHCCGERDCEILDPAIVRATPSGYVLGGKFGGEVVPYTEATPSEDGKYWRCHTAAITFSPWGTGQQPERRRCFFAPVGTE